MVKGVTNYPVDAKGHRESKALGIRIARYKPTIVVSSPLARATEPARAIARKAGVKMKIDKGLLPQDFGIIEGEKRATGEKKISDYAMHHFNKKIPGGGSTAAWDKKNKTAESRD